MSRQRFPFSLLDPADQSPTGIERPPGTSPLDDPVYSVNKGHRLAGRPPKVVDLPKLVELTNAGLAIREIAAALGVSRSVVNRARQTAYNEGILERRRRQPKTVVVAMTSTLDRRDRAIVLYSISVAIEHENLALDRCQEIPGGFGVREAIHSRENSLRELRRTRSRLLSRVE
jgi:hypothetical protein